MEMAAAFSTSSNQIISQDAVNIVLCICVWAIVGCMARIWIDEIVGPNILNVSRTDSLLVSSFFSNVIGCFIIGALAGSFSKTSRTETKMALYTGLATGFCGACTTFSSWVLQTSDIITANSESNHFRAPVFGILFTLFGLASYIISHRVGLDVGDVMPLFSIYPVQTLKEQSLFYGNIIGLSGAIVTLSLLLFLDVENWKRRKWYMSLIFAPFGALFRFSLSKRFNGFKNGIFPLGTFIANILGSVILAFISYASDSEEGWSELMTWAFVTGFVSSLTTMSTLITEVVAIRADFGPKNSYFYLFCSIILAEILVGIISMGK